MNAYCSLLWLEEPDLFTDCDRLTYGRSEVCLKRPLKLLPILEFLHFYELKKRHLVMSNVAHLKELQATYSSQLDSPASGAA